MLIPTLYYALVAFSVVGSASLVPADAFRDQISLGASHDVSRASEFWPVVRRLRAFRVSGADLGSAVDAGSPGLLSGRDEPQPGAARSAPAAHPA